MLLDSIENIPELASVTTGTIKFILVVIPEMRKTKTVQRISSKLNLNNP